MIDHLRRSGLVCIALLLVVGCGGGGTDSGSLPDSGQPDGDGSTDAGTGSDPDSGSDTDGGDTGDDTADAGLSAFASEMLAAVNAERADAGEAALAWNPQLTQAATAHAEDMQTNDFFSHTGSDGSAVGDRVHATGYAYGMAGENIARGYVSVSAVMTGWMNSDGHRANILKPGYTEMGAARVGDYWVQVFARPLNPAKPTAPVANG